MCDRNVTPRSSMRTASEEPVGPPVFLISAATFPWPIENTWKPPESVTIGPSHPMNSWSPPKRAMSSWPGSRNRWYVFPRIKS
jgi:hypothetical protein